MQRVGDDSVAIRVGETGARVCVVQACGVAVARQEDWKPHVESVEHNKRLLALFYTLGRAK